MIAWPPACDGDLLLVDHPLVEARALAGGEDVARHLQGVGVRLARLRHVVGDHHRRQRRVAVVVDGAALGRLRRLLGDLRGIGLPCGDRAEVLLDPAL